MSGTFSPCLSILPESQRRLWPELRPAAGLGFVLYGGTAVALRLGHRQSADFDFFTAKPLDREALNEAFPFIRRAIVLQSGPETLTLNDLSLGLAIAKAVFGNAFQPSESLKAMTWFEGGDLQLLTGDEKRTLIEAASAVRRLPQIDLAAHGRLGA